MFNYIKLNILLVRILQMKMGKNKSTTHEVWYCVIPIRIMSSFYNEWQKWFLLNIVRTNKWIRMKLQISIVINNDLFWVITRQFVSVFNSWLLTKNGFYSVTCKQNDSIFKYFILQMKLFSLVHSTNSMCGLGIKCITLLPHQTYPSSLHAMVGYYAGLQCFYEYMYYSQYKLHCRN